jgi:hypothetical protein
LAVAAGFVGAVISRAVPTGLAPANDNWPVSTRLRRPRREPGAFSRRKQG